MVQTPSDFNRRVGIGAALLAGIGAIAIGAASIVFSSGSVPASGGILAASIAFMNLAAWGGFTLYVVKEKKRREVENPDVLLLAEAKKIAGTFHTELLQRKLGKTLHPDLCELLENSSRDWKRIRDALDGHFWTDENLPDHWRLVKDQASKAADRAMAEILLLLQDELKNPSTPSDWQEVIEDTLQNLGFPSAQSRRRFDHLPVEYTAAHDVEIRLRSLAEEVEAASREVLGTDDLRTRLNASKSIDDTLSELRTIREAEAELRQNQ